MSTDPTTPANKLRQMMSMLNMWDAGAPMLSGGLLTLEQGEEPEPESVPEPRPSPEPDTPSEPEEDAPPAADSGPGATRARRGPRPSSPTSTP